MGNPTKMKSCMLVLVLAVSVLFLAPSCSAFDSVDDSWDLLNNNTDTDGNEVNGVFGFNPDIIGGPAVQTGIVFGLGTAIGSGGTSAASNAAKGKKAMLLEESLSEDEEEEEEVEEASEAKEGSEASESEGANLEEEESDADAAPAKATKAVKAVKETKTVKAVKETKAFEEVPKKTSTKKALQPSFE